MNNTEIKISTSEVPAIIGVDTHKTAVNVWEEKTGKVTPTETTEAMEIGSALKEVAKRVWEVKTGKIVKPGVQVSSGHSCGTVDGMVDGTPVMIQTTPFAWDEIPEAVKVKAQHYMAMGGWSSIKVICMVSGCGKAIEEHEIEADASGKAILEAVEHFVENVEKEVAPAPQTIEDCRRIWSKSEGDTVEATEEIAAKIEALKAATAKAKEAEAEADALKKSIMEVMGSAETLTVNGKKAITWKSNKDSVKTDYKALVEALAPSAEVLAEHTSTVPGARVFRIAK